jgi:hypothetical protein
MWLIAATIIGLLILTKPSDEVCKSKVKETAMYMTTNDFYNSITPIEKVADSTLRSFGYGKSSDEIVTKNWESNVEIQDFLILKVVTYRGLGKSRSLLGIGMLNSLF